MSYDFDDSSSRPNRRQSGAGGTPGGIGEFLLGLGMVVVGGYLFTSRVTVSTGYWSWGGYNLFGLSLLPLIMGIAILFYSGRSVVGWLLLFSGALIIFAGILMNLRVFFESTSLFHTLLILVLLAGGIGLVARSLRAH